MRHFFLRLRRAVVAVMLASVVLLAGGAGRPPAASPTALGRFDLRRRAARQVPLPSELREVSGLAVDARGALYAHGDERGVIRQLHAASGRIVRSFPIGDPPVRADLEGIAVAGQQLVVMTSDGLLYTATLGMEGTAGPFTRTDTGLGPWCELEGMAYDHARDLLLIGCKLPAQPTGNRNVTLFRWSRAAGHLAQPDRITVPMSQVTRASGVSRFHPSGVEVDPVTGHYALLAGRERALVEISPAGDVLAGARLPHSLHAQPEGLALLGDSLLLIADEASGGRPTITAYHRVR